MEEIKKENQTIEQKEQTGGAVNIKKPEETEEPKQESQDWQNGSQYQQNAQYTYDPDQMYKQNQSPKKTLSTAALVLGIVAIVFDFVYLWIGLIVGIVGIVIGAKARKEEDAQGMAFAGFICSIVAVVIAGAMLACVICSIGAFVGINTIDF